MSTQLFYLSIKNKIKNYLNIHMPPNNSKDRKRKLYYLTVRSLMQKRPTNIQTQIKTQNLQFHLFQLILNMNWLLKKDQLLEKDILFQNPLPVTPKQNSNLSNYQLENYKKFLNKNQFLTRTKLQVRFRISQMK